MRGSLTRMSQGRSPSMATSARSSSACNNRRLRSTFTARPLPPPHPALRGVGGFSANPAAHVLQSFP